MLHDYISYLEKQSCQRGEIQPPLDWLRVMSFPDQPNAVIDLFIKKIQESGIFPTNLRTSLISFIEQQFNTQSDRVRNRLYPLQVEKDTELLLDMYQNKKGKRNKKTVRPDANTPITSNSSVPKYQLVLPGSRWNIDNGDIDRYIANKVNTANRNSLLLADLVTMVQIIVKDPRGLGVRKISGDFDVLSPDSSIRYPKYRFSPLRHPHASSYCDQSSRWRLVFHLEPDDLTTKIVLDDILHHEDFDSKYHHRH